MPVRVALVTPLRDANEDAFRQSVINEIDPESPVGISTIQPFFTGPTAEAYTLEKPCFEAVELGG